MKEKLLLAIVITFALSCVHGLSATTASRPNSAELIEELNSKPVAHLMQNY